MCTLYLSAFDGAKRSMAGSEGPTISQVAQQYESLELIDSMLLMCCMTVHRLIQIHASHKSDPQDMIMLHYTLKQHIHTPLQHTILKNELP
jgi:hypothetical protein